jgi:hypothetical protein
MKRGGPGYVQPDTDAFPEMEDMNAFVMASGGIPTLAWLNGLTEGEKDIERLLDIAMASEVEAINIIPDRNFTPGVKDEKLTELQRVIAIAQARELPVVVGTEMNSPGQKFVDQFDSAELSPYVPLFMKGAYIVYGHSVMQRRCHLGYKSDWAKMQFKDRGAKNAFYEQIGRLVQPGRDALLAEFDADISAQQILEAIC